MDPSVFRILDAKRFGRPVSEADIRALTRGAADGSWGDAELGAFLMAAAIHGLTHSETQALTLGMLDSGERWRLAEDVPTLGDKHSTGGVGDKVSLILAPLMAACGRPVVMLTGRGLGHTGGTADKLEAIPGLDLALDRARCLRAIEATGMAIGMATERVAPADRRLYALRDRTGTVASVALVTASIVSKKVASGAAALVYDVKTGPGAFFVAQEDAMTLARMLVDTTEALGTRASALVTDMSQPLGRWVGHGAEVNETLDVLAGEGAADLIEVTFALCSSLAEMTGAALDRQALEGAISSGRAREIFLRWARNQGAEAAWTAQPHCPLAPVEVVLEAPRSGVLSAVHSRRLGELIAAVGGGRLVPDGRIDMGISLRVEKKLGDTVQTGEPLARLSLRRPDAEASAALGACFVIADEGQAPPRIYCQIRGDGRARAPGPA